MTKEEEEVLWENGQLGGGTPWTLFNTIWWLLTQHFDLRGRQEHHQMKVEDFTFQRDDDRNEFLTFAKGPTKTRQGGLSAYNQTQVWKPDSSSLKCLPQGMRKSCPVMLFNLYLGKWPSQMDKSGPFYLTVMERLVSSVWYKKTPKGKNNTNTIMKNRKMNSPFKNLCLEKNLTNHSTRKPW